MLQKCVGAYQTAQRKKQIEQKQHKNHLGLKNRRDEHQRAVGNRENKEHRLSCGWDENGTVVMQQPNNLLGE